MNITIHANAEVAGLIEQVCIELGQAIFDTDFDDDGAQCHINIGTTAPAAMVVSRIAKLVADRTVEAANITYDVLN